MTSMTAQNEPGCAIGIAAVPNMRDVGGWPTRDGRQVRRGLVYRSTQLNQLTGADMATFEALGIRSVYDLRTAKERAQQPDQLPSGTQYVVIDVMSDSTDAAPTQLFSVMNDPKAAEEMLGGGKGLQLFQTGYREIVNLTSAATGYRRLFSDLSSDQHRPALFHCTTGKDRTGWAAASLLMLLGVSDELVMQEYLLTNDELLPAEQPVLERFRSMGGDPELIMPCVAVAPEYLEAALDEMRQRYGTIEGYFSEALGIDDGAQQQLRSIFTEGA
jgi:protein-tyrosine phosphatase